MAYSFAAGPARIPDPVLARARRQLFSRGPDGASPLERPFTGAGFRTVLAKARRRLTELLDLPPNYRILFLAGGAMHQFSLLPMNLLGPAGRAAYADSGYWAQRALEVGSRYGEMTVAARYPGPAPLAAPALSGWELPSGCAYCHITPNETVDGIAYPALPDTGSVPLVADCTSCFLTGPMDVSRFGLIYASAQKNIGPSGLTVVIVRDDLLARSPATVPDPHSYRIQAEQDSCINTPPNWAIHLAALVLEWLAESGGLPAMAAANRRKAERIYGVIDGSAGFYCAPVEREHRSLSNIRFHLQDDGLTEVFIGAAEAAGLHHLRGHPRIGGLRASLYNAMPEEGAQALADFLTQFAQRFG